MKNNSLLIGIVSFFAGVGIMFIYNNYRINKTKEITRKLMTNYVETFMAANNIIYSCDSAYNEVKSCVVNATTCDFEKSRNNLKIYNQQRENSDKILKTLGAEMEVILKEVKSSKLN